VNRVRLAGWKKIADFVGRDVRTVQNWERVRAFPVHRLPGGAGSTVYTFAEEIAAWLDGVQATDCAPQIAPGLLVLPLDHSALDPGQAFVADGLAQELIGRLAAVSLSSVRVLSWTTARTYRNAGKPAPAISRELGVRYLVEGALKRAVDRWEVDLRVVDAAEDRVILADRFACAGRDVLLMQADIAEALTSHLALHLAGDLHEPMWTHPTDPRAFVAFLDGVRKFGRGTDGAMASALRSFDEALDGDPTLVPARAYKGLALLQSDHQTAWLQADVQRTVRELSARCDAEGGRLVSSALLSGLIGRNDCDWDRVDRRLTTTVASNPSAVAARLLLAGNLTLRRKFEGARDALAPVEGLERSLEADKAIAHALLWSRDYAGAIARFDVILRDEPDHMYASLMRFMAAIYQADAAAAERYGKAISPALRAPYDTFIEGCRSAIEGRDADARALREEVERRADDARLAWYHVAMLDGLLGDAGAAALHLARSHERHEGTCSLGAVDPSFDKVRGDARFRAAVRAMGLPE